MPYKAALSDQERFHRLNCLSVALCRERRAVAKSIKERDGWARTLKFSLDYPARYPTCQTDIVRMQAIVAVYDKLLLTQREVVTATERLRQAALQESQCFFALKRWQTEYFIVLKKFVAPDKVLAHRELMTRLDEEFLAAISESPTSLRPRRAQTEYLTALRAFVARESIAKPEFAAIIAKFIGGAPKRMHGPE